MELGIFQLPCFHELVAGDENLVREDSGSSPRNQGNLSHN